MVHSLAEGLIGFVVPLERGKDKTAWVDYIREITILELRLRITE